MRLYDYETFDLMWAEAVHALTDVESTRPSRDGDVCGEVAGYSARLLDVDDNWLWSPTRKASATYAAAELLWYLSGTGNGEMIKFYAPQYERFLVDGVARGAYGARWGRWNQLRNLLDLLRRDLTTRQAVMVAWEARDLAVAVAGNEPDVPCTVSLQFLYRGQLNLVATMRSNDVWLGMPYDVWCFTSIQKLVAHALGVKPGWYQHQAGSLHLYARDRERAIARVTRAPELPPPRRYDLWPVDLSKAIEEAVHKESAARLESCTPVTVKGNLLDECVALCAGKAGVERPAWLREDLR